MKNQALLISAVGIVSALLLGLATFTIIQTISLDALISELPEKINSDLRDITKTLADRGTS